VAVDQASIDNGCLQVVAGRHNEGYFETNDKGVITTEIEKKLGFEYEFVPTQPGDLIFFHSYCPHKSGVNTSSRTRRAAFLTYSKVEEGDWHSKYYEHKFANMGSDRVSFIGDFQGKVVH